MMLRNACESLRPGGYFIATTPDANELVLVQASLHCGGHRQQRSTRFTQLRKTNLQSAPVVNRACLLVQSHNVVT